MKNYLSLLVCCVLLLPACATASEKKKSLAQDKLRSMERSCLNLNQAYLAGKSEIHCDLLPERNYIHIFFNSQAVYLSARGDTAKIVQAWCQANQEAYGVQAMYSWTFGKEKFSRQERCASPEEKLKKREAIHGQREKARYPQDPQASSR